MSLMLAGFLMARSSQAAGAAAGAASTARHAIATADVATRSVTRLEEQVEGLTLLVLALVETLKSRAGVTEEEILRELNVLDLRDGTKDGRMAVAAKQCASCARTMASHHPRCLYCGGDALSDAPPGSVEALLR